MLMIIEILHDQPDKTGKLEAHADDFTAVGTLTDLTVLWKKFCNLDQDLDATCKLLGLGLSSQKSYRKKKISGCNWVS